MDDERNPRWASMSLNANPGCHLPGDYLPAFAWAGPGPGNGPVQGDPKKEYVGVPGFGDLRSLPQLLDELTCALGPRVIDAMMSDPVVRQSALTVRTGAIGDGPTLTPAFPTPDGSNFDPDNPPDGLTDDQVESKRALDFCRWIDDGLITPIGHVAFQLSKCFVYQNALAEKVYEARTAPDGTSWIVPRDIRVKDWWQWWFVVDRTNRIDSILCLSPQPGAQYNRVDPDKFVIASYLADSDSPQGACGIAPCYPWWKLKYQVPGNAAKFVRLFSLPIPVLTMANSPAPALPRDAQGKIAGKREKSPTEMASDAVKAVMAGAGAVLPAGADMKLMESQENADPFVAVVDLCDRQIVHGITGSARTSLEARNGSKADAEASQDVGIDLVKVALRSAVSMALRRHHYRDALARNFGEDFADRYTPTVSFGQSNKQDIAKVGAAIAQLVTAGVIHPSQYQAVVRMILGWDLPEPTDGPDRVPDDGGD